MELCERRAHPDAELRVEIRKRLVHQKRARLAHDRASHRDALPLPAGKLRRLALEEIAEAEHRRDLLHAPPRLSLRRAPDLEAVPHVLTHRHVGVEGVALEHHRDVPVAGCEVGHVDVVDPHRARGHLLEPCHHAQKRRLAAAGGPDEDDELAVRDREAHVVDGDEAVSVHLRDPVEVDRRHA